MLSEKAKFSFSIAEMLCRFIYKALLIDIDIVGKENLPDNEGFIIVSNHASNADPLLLISALDRQLCFFTKQELIKIPLLGWALKETGNIIINREIADIKAFKNSLKLLQKKQPLVIFPEGTRSFDGQLGKAHNGVSYIIHKAKVPVIPIGIKGSYDFLKKGSRIPTYSNITLKIGSPVNMKEFCEQKLTKELMGKMTDSIMENLKKLLN